MSAPFYGGNSVRLSPVTPDEPTDVRTSDAGAAAGRTIDDVDRALLRELLRDGRISFAELAERCHVSRSTAHARVEALRRSGVITGFTATLDPTALGLGIVALVFLRIRQHDWRAARDEIVRVRGVESLVMCAGEFDLVATVRCHDMAEFRDVLLVRLHAIDGVTGSETAFVLDEVRQPIRL
jgi:DNA-binding Lrp family transcriptional regulator